MKNGPSIQMIAAAALFGAVLPLLMGVKPAVRKSHRYLKTDAPLVAGKCCLPTAVGQTITHNPINDSWLLEVNLLCYTGPYSPCFWYVTSTVQRRQPDGTWKVIDANCLNGGTTCGQWADVTMSVADVTHRFGTGTYMVTFIGHNACTWSCADQNPADPSPFFVKSAIETIP